MDEDELAQLRAKRLAELQEGRGSGGPQGEKEQQREKEEEFRNTILTQLLSQEARARLNTLKVAKPEKGKMVEDILIRNARMGAIRGQLQEEDLKDILDKVSEQTTRKTTVKYDRRRAGLDSDEDDY